MANNDPPEREVKDFEFIQLCKFRVSPPGQELSSQRGKLLACSSQYGLVVYSTNQGFSAVKTADLLAIDEAKGTQRSKVIVEDIPVLTSVTLTSPLLSMDISGDGLYLAVAVRDLGQLTILIYDIRTFAEKATSPAPFARSRVTASSSAIISDMSWNPAVSTMLAVCTSDGNVELIDVTDSPKVIAVLVAAAGATCFCWSPKGKQLLVGRKDGTLAQYDHSLAEKKVWPCPSLLIGPHAAVDVVWQSTYVFLAAYLPLAAEPSDQPSVIMTSCSKDSKTVNVNFEDVCFGNGKDRKAQYFFHFIQKWDVILMASSNATETTVVGRNLDDKTSWEHWSLPDTSRAELPLTADHNDSFPMGLVVDYSPHKTTVISESKTLPPCPVMYLLSTDGMLVGFHLHYSHKDAAPATVPPLTLAATGARKGDISAAPVSVVKPAPSAPQPAPPSASALAPIIATIPATKPLSASTPVAGFPLTTSATNLPFQTTLTAAGQSKLPFANLTAPSATTTAPLFQFGVALKPEGSTNQKQPIPSQVPQINPPDPPQFSFGSQTATPPFMFGQPKTTSQNSAFAGVAPAFSSPATTKPTAQVQMPMTFGGGQVSSNPPQMVFATPTTATATPTSIFGLAKTSPVARDEGSKLIPLMATAAPQPHGMGQQRPSAPSASTLSPAVISQTQTTQSPLTPASEMPQGSSGKSITPALPVESSIKATVDSVFTQNILEEIADFEKELAELRMRSRREVKSVGTREEMMGLRQDREKMMIYSTEIIKVTKEQKREVQEQTSTCFNMLAMAEDCKSRYERDSDPHYHSLLLGRALDPASSERLKALQQMSQAIELSIVEVDHTLDMHWQEHLEQKKREKRLYTPAGETLYKSIRNNHIVIASQRQQLEKLEQQMRNLRLHSKLSSRDDSGDKLSPMTTMQLPGTGRNNSAVANVMTPEKVAKLKEILSERKVPRIKSTAPANLSMSRIVSLTPSRSPGVATTPQPPPFQQQTPQRPPQQRKHHLPHPVQNLSSPFNLQADTPTGQQVQLSLQQHVNQFQLGPAQIKSLHFPGGAQLPASTSFSGVAYFKQAPQAATAIRPNVTDGVLSPVIVTKPGLGLMPGAVPSPGMKLDNTPLKGANISLTPQMKANTPTPVSSLTPQMKANTPTPVTNLTPTTAQHPDLYEDVTPTETEEDEDEENGYEDEDEDEEETGFEGIPHEIAQNMMRSGSNGFTLGSPKLVTATPASAPNALLFGKAATGAEFGQKSDIKQSTGNTFGGPAIFGKKPVVLPSGGPGPVFGSQATPSKMFGFSDLASKSAARQAGKENLGEETSPAASQEANPQPATSASVHLPTAAVVSNTASAFSFIQAAGGSEPSVQGDAKPVITSLFGGASTPATVTSVFGGTSTPATVTSALGGAATVTSVFGGASTPVTAPLSATSVFGGISTPATATSVFGGASTPAAVTSVFGGKSPTEGSRFSFGTTPSAQTSAPAGFSFTTSAGSTTPVSGAASATTLPSSAAAEKTLAGSEGGDRSSESGPATGTSSDAATIQGIIEGATDQVATTPTSASSEVVIPAPLFGAATSSSPSAVDASKTMPTIFGQGDAAAAVFGGGSAVTSTVTAVTLSSPLFDSPTATSSTAFGAVPSTTATLFGSMAATTPATAPLFGVGTLPGFGSSAGTTAATSLFGMSTTTTTTASVFGSTPASSSSSFGAGVTAASPFAGAGSVVFGGAVSTTPTSLFVSTTTSSAPAFGFGTAASTSPAFGSTTPASSSGGMFGGSGLFGSASGTSASTGLFGSGSSSTSAFGSGSATDQTAGSLFGQTTTSIGFGGSSGAGTSLFGQSSTFGHQPASSSSGSVFGFGGLGGKPSEEKSKLNVFGTPQVFGGSTSQTNTLFGNSGSRTFGGISSTSFSTAPGSFSASTGGVASSGFGVTTNQPTSGGFGAAPTFGTTASFGSSPAFGSKLGGFGSSPTFGGSPAFGSNLSFSSPTSSTSAFGNAAGGGFSGFANAAAPSFGQLAQSSPTTPAFGTPAPSSPFGGGFGSSQPAFGSSSLFGQGTTSPGFGAGQAQGFGSTSSFGTNPAFSSYRG